MEYLETSYAPLAVVGIGFAAKKLAKKDLVPVSGWKQMLSTYLTVLGGVFVSNAIKTEIAKRKTTPKPN